MLQVKLRISCTRGLCPAPDLSCFLFAYLLAQYAVAVGPVATAMAVGTGFEYYSGGVYDGSDCPAYAYA